MCFTKTKCSGNWKVRTCKLRPRNLHRRVKTETMNLHGSSTSYASLTSEPSQFWSVFIRKIKLHIWSFDIINGKILLQFRVPPSSCRSRFYLHPGSSSRRCYLQYKLILPKFIFVLMFGVSFHFRFSLLNRSISIQIRFTFL